MFDFRLPDYEVVAHVRCTAFSKALEDEMLSITAAYHLQESTEYDGVRDYHWAFESWDGAVRAGEELSRLTDNPNLLILRVKANYDESIEPITHKEMVPPNEMDVRLFSMTRDGTIPQGNLDWFLWCGCSADHTTDTLATVAD